MGHRNRRRRPFSRPGVAKTGGKGSPRYWRSVHRSLAPAPPPSWTATPRIIGGTRMATTPTSLRHYAWVIVAAAFSMLMVSGGMIAAMGVFVKPIPAELGAPRRAVSLAYAIHMLSLGAASFAFGALADRTRIRRLALFGGTLYGVSLILAARSRALWHLYASYGFLASVGVGALWGPFAPLIARWFTARRGLAIGIVYSGVGVGTLLMSPLAARIISVAEWRTALAAFGVAALAINTGAALLLADRPSHRGLMPYGAAPEERAGLARPWTWREALGAWQLWALAATFFLCCASHSTLMLHMVPHATDHGAATATARPVPG